MNGSSYLVLRIMASFQRMVVQPPPWVSAPSSACVTQDMVVSEGLRLNQTLPFNLTFSNTIFLFNCSPRLLLTPLNCTPSSLCHRYLESSGSVDKNRALNCAGNPDLNPCCTFVAGGMPSAYKIRLHNSGCKAFRSILRLDPKKPASQWEEGVEIQWASPPEPVCNSKLDCSGASKCLPAGTSGLSRCLCNRGYNWDHVRGTCLGNKHKSKASGLLSLEVSIGVISFISFAAILVLISAIDFSRDQDDVNLAIYVSQAAKNGAIMEVVDRRLIGAEPSGDVLSSVRLFSELAFSCLREKKADRPGMREVVQQLERIVQTVLQCSDL
ncbi:WALL-ASSOCIATED RECEPTOR KINASE-LIKE 21 [Salix koriyanagi]|uniref:WALL-ASSOCIATED RECEPTOR KINASE-LIKE 21 n=1 Tax=Salix koriyanagi TaxID=2511006 RepID=A0A9Q0VE73_9ROSI|nr:WALL-ASSOCIATED RECEPTOR KINASE-LIKE 21 [Salix koriyanagi]